MTSPVYRQVVLIDLSDANQARGKGKGQGKVQQFLCDFNDFFNFFLLYHFFEYQGPVKCSYLPKYMKYSKMGHRNEIYVKFRTRIDLQNEKLKKKCFLYFGVSSTLRVQSHPCIRAWLFKKLKFKSDLALSPT